MNAALKAASVRRCASRALYFSSWPCFMTGATFQTNIDTILLDDGNIQFRFNIGTGSDVFFVCTPAQAAAFATQLLNAVNSSHVLTGDPSSLPQGGSITVDATIPVRGWFFGTAQAQGSKAIGVHIGDTKIGFAVTENQMRGLGRTLVNASWKSQSAVPSRALLWLVIKEFNADVCAWSTLLWSRLVTAISRRALVLRTWVLGRAFRQFRSAVIASGIPIPTYDPVNFCVYCGETVYSRQSGVRQHPLGAEHIIAEGIGGTIELPLASCAKCEEVTGAVIEGDVLGRTLKALRVHLKLKKKRSGPPPKTLPIQTKIDGRDKTLEMPVEDYPILFYMLSLGPPDLDGPGGTPMMFGARIVIIRYDQNYLFKKYRLGAFSTPYWDQHTFCRMLAKIGHSYAVAELTRDKFSPALTNLIRLGDMAATKFIGGIFDGTPERRSQSLHELALGYQRINRKTYVVARIRLFAKYDGPTYAVIVGESLEHPIARAKRVFSSRISRMLAR